LAFFKQFSRDKMTWPFSLFSILKKIVSFENLACLKLLMAKIGIFIFWGPGNPDFA
jgi:hypothetical protein